MDQIGTGMVVTLAVEQYGMPKAEHECTGWEYDERKQTLKLYDQSVLKALFSNVTAFRVTGRHHLATEAEIADAEARINARLGTVQDMVSDTYQQVVLMQSQVNELTAEWKGATSTDKETPPAADVHREAPAEYETAAGV